MAMDVYVFIGIFFVLILLAVLFLIPTSQDSFARKRAKAKREAEPENKDWQAVSLRLEKHIYALREEINGLKKNEKVLEKELEIQREKNNKLQEKLNQERGWQEKEKSDIEKKAAEIQRLKNDQQANEQMMAREHSTRLGLERENREVTRQLAATSELKRNLEGDNAKLNAQLDACRKEIMELKSENALLSRKQQDETWIAKTEYVKLESQLRSLEKELSQMKKTGPA